MSKTPYQNEFEDAPRRTAAEQKIELARRKARAKLMRQNNENAKRK